MVQNSSEPVEVGSWNPIIYKVFYISGGVGFQPSTVGCPWLVNKLVCNLFTERIQPTYIGGEKIHLNLLSTSRKSQQERKNKAWVQG